MRLFELSANRELLITLLQLLYNSFALPDSMDTTDIIQVIDLTLKKNYLTAHNGLYEFIPYSVDELDILQGITLRIEKAN